MTSDSPYYSRSFNYMTVVNVTEQNKEEKEVAQHA